MAQTMREKARLKREAKAGGQLGLLVGGAEMGAPAPVQGLESDDLPGLFSEAEEAQEEAAAADWDAWRLARGIAGEGTSEDYWAWREEADRRRPELFDLARVVDGAEDEGRYFASGSNQRGRIRGFAMAGYNVGVAVNELHPAGEEELLACAGTGTLVFIDSGAFAEFGGKPITDEEWERRLAMYLRLGRVLREQAYFVAPDKVADQVGTLARMRRYAPAMQELARLGCNIIVPVPMGDLGLFGGWMAALRALNLPCEPVAGLPMKRSPLSPEEVEAFVGQAQPRRVHLLGRGPRNPEYAPMAAAVRRGAPRCEVYSDSVAAKAMAKREPAGVQAPKRGELTAENDAVEAEGVFDPVERETLALVRVLRRREVERLTLLRRVGWAPTFGAVA